MKEGLNLPYIAAFCPNCGYHLNEVDVDLPEHLQTHDYGEEYTCYWCKTRQTDWNHMKRCRYTHEIEEQLRLSAIAARLAEIEEDLTRQG